MIGLMFTTGLQFGAGTAEGQENVITLRQFDAWIFHRMGDPSSVRASLRAGIDREIRRLERVVSLTESQKAKIRLAGMGDIKRFFDQVQRARQEFVELGEVTQNDINEAFQLARPLSQRISSGFYGDGSLLKKVSLTIQDPEQSEAVRESRRRSLEKKRGIVIRSHLAQLGRTVPMLANQRQRLIELLSESVEIKNCPPQYYPMLISYRLSEVPKDALREFLDDNQIRAIEASFPFPRGVNVKAVLIQQGVIDE
jgi:hypothetical protein